MIRPIPLLSLLIAAALAGCATQAPAPVAPAPTARPAEPVTPEVLFPEPAPEPVPEPVTPTPPVTAPAGTPHPTGMPAFPVYPNEAAARAAVQRLLPGNVRDRAGWTNDIVNAFSALHLSYRADNFCAVMAIIEQESLWQADRAIPGLNQMVWKEIETRRQKYLIPKLVLDAALLKHSPNGRSYKDRIDSLRTEREMNELFGDMIDELPYGKTLLAGKNPIRTGGPMQVSVAFAEQQVKYRPYPYPKKGTIRDEVFTRRGGIYFGTSILLDYPAPYSQMRYRFADFNAGRYASRNAAFQQAVARLSGRRLSADGDILSYGGGSAGASDTQAAVLSLAGRLGLSAGEIQRDLKLEKVGPFAATPTYQRLFALADRQYGHQPRETLPQIQLTGPKIQRKITTAWFADRVEGRYRSCLARR